MLFLFSGAEKMAANEAIGSFNFVTLEGVPEDRSPVVNFESRHGVEDVAIFLETTKRGTPFTMRSFRDFASLAAAKTALLSYLAAKGSTESITYGGTQEPRKYTILNCKPVEEKAIVAAYGGAETVGRAKLVCDWTLISRDIAA